MVSGPSRGRTSNDFLFFLKLPSSLIHSILHPGEKLTLSSIRLLPSCASISFTSLSISLRSLPSCRVAH